MKIKRVMRYDSGARLYRLGRLTWDRGTVGDGKGYSNKLSVGLVPVIARFRRELDGWIFTLFGVRIHYRRSWGGRFA